MHFDLTDLKLFLNIHAAGTITGGAEATHMTLASASERIRGLEDTLGTALLRREPRGVQPTPAGHTLLHHARLVLQQVEQLQGELGAHGSGLRGHVRLLCNTSALGEHLPEVLSGFLHQHPGIAIDLEERASQDIADALRDDRCDLGVASDAVDLGGLQTQVFRPDPLVLVLPRNHPLATLKRAALADVADQPFVGLVEGSALQAHLALQARRQGLGRLNHRIRLRSLEAVCRLVGLGTGIAIVPQAVAQRCARTAHIRRLPLTDAWAQRQLVICARSFDALPLAARQMAQHLVAHATPPPAG